MGVIIKLPHARARNSGGLRKASIGTLLPVTSLSRMASRRDASLRPATMLRTCECEQPAAAAISAIDHLLRLAQRSIGCSDMAGTFSTRKRFSQDQKFLEETSNAFNDLVRFGMGKKAKPAQHEIFLGEWMAYFEVGPTEAARIAGCGPSYISNIISGRKTNINTLYLLALSEAWGVTINDFFGRPPSQLLRNELQHFSAKARETILNRSRRKA